MKTRRYLFCPAVNKTILLVAFLLGHNSFAKANDNVENSLGEKCWFGTYSCQSNQETVTLRTWYDGNLNFAQIFGNDKNYPVGVLVLREYGAEPRYSVHYRGTENPQDSFVCETGKLRFNDKDYLCE